MIPDPRTAMIAGLRRDLKGSLRTGTKGKQSRGTRSVHKDEAMTLTPEKGVVTSTEK